jgi:putative transposase
MLIIGCDYHPAFQQIAVGISQATYYLWKRKYSGVGVSELRELRQLREEVGRLKRLVADLSLDRQILQEIVSKKL